ncbi:hypothetical protein QTP88_014389 [Uroleucon formosanum]
MENDLWFYVSPRVVYRVFATKARIVKKPNTYSGRCKKKRNIINQRHRIHEDEMFSHFCINSVNRSISDK